MSKTSLWIGIAIIVQMFFNYIRFPKPDFLALFTYIAGLFLVVLLFWRIINENK